MGGLPVMKGHWLRGQYDALLTDPLALFARAAKEHGDVVRLRFFQRPFVLVNDAELVPEILSLPRPPQGPQLLWELTKTPISPRLAQEPSAAVLREEVHAAFDRWREKGIVTLDIARAAKVIAYRVLGPGPVSWSKAEALADGAPGAHAFDAELPASTIAWALALLWQSPVVLRDTIDEARSPAGPRPLLERIIAETLRLYPGEWAIDRVASSLGPHALDEDSVLVISPWLLHRHPRHWVAAERFDPDRFLPEQRARLPSNAYVRSVAGPLVPIFLSEFLGAFEYRALTATLPKAQALLTLKPRGGVPLQIFPRKARAAWQEGAGAAR